MQRTRPLKAAAGYLIVAVLSWTPTALGRLAVVQGAQELRASGLRILVIEGEDAVNVIQQKTAVAPLIEVRDRNNQPVAGAAVTFAIQGGRATFNGSSALTVTSNAAGRATVTGLTPTSSGALRIGVSATFQGQKATITIVQTNVLTAAQAASAIGAAAAGTGGGSGLSGAAVAGIIGGAGAGVGALVVARGGSPPPTITTSITGIGIRDVTQYSFSASGGDKSATYSWDFGDGATAAGPDATHVFNQEGSFQVTLRASGSGSAETAATGVVVGSLNGIWAVRITQFPPIHTHRLFVTQQGASISGQWVIEWEAPSFWGSPGNPTLTVFTGTITHPRTIAITQTGECQRTVTGSANSDLTTMGGPETFGNANCINPGPLTVTRQ